MPPKTKTEAEIIQFLIACVEHSEKTDWQAIAVNTGLYKAGKFSKQAFDGHKKKYGSASAADPPTVSKSTPVKKRKGADGDESPSKKTKAKQEKVKEEEDDVEEEDEDEEAA